MQLTRRDILRLAFMGIALVALILLISSIAQIELDPGLPFSSILAFIFGDFMGLPHAEVAGISSPFGDMLITVLRAIFFIAIVAFPFVVMMVILDPKLRKRVLRAALRLAILAALLILALRNQAEEIVVEGEPAPSAMQPSEEPGEIVPLTDEEFDPETVPSWVVWTASLVTGLLLAATIIVIVNQIRKARPQETSMEKIARKAREALRDLQGGGDYRDTILRCYAEMSRVVREERGVSRNKDVTAREFTDYLIQEQLPDEPVRQLTRLFEKARYSAATPTANDEMTAITSLEAIIAACLAIKPLVKDVEDTTASDTDGLDVTGAAAP